MNETKPIWQSRTFWGAVIAAAAPVLSLITHKALADADVQAAADALTAGAAFVGFALTIYGRYKASKAIGPAAPAEPKP